MKCAIALALVFAVVIPSAVPAQAPARTDAITRALAGLPDVPVRLREGERVSEFERLEFNNGAFTLRDGDVQRPLIPGEVTSIWVRETRAARAASIGMAVGAGIGFVAGFVGTATAGPCSSHFCAPPAVAGVIFALPGLVVGSIAGATIGVAFPRWRRIYP